MTDQQNDGSGGVLWGWMQILRLPNLLTVPGDVLAGYALTHLVTAQNFGPNIFLLVGSSLCIYMAGLLLNDWKDRDEDALKRPERPLPSGRLSSGSVLGGAVCLLLVGLTLAGLAGGIPFRVALLLVGCVIFYNLGARRTPIIGFVTMGTCRGANLLLGASITSSNIGNAILLAVFIYTTHVILITWTADREKEALATRRRFFVTLGCLAITLATFLLIIQPGILPLISAMVAVVYPLIDTQYLNPGDEPDGIGYVGSLVRGLIPVQATFALAADHQIMSMILIFAVLLITSDIAGRKVTGG